MRDEGSCARHAMPRPTVTGGSSGRTRMVEWKGRAWAAGMMLMPSPAATRAMSVDVSVASCTMRGRMPARRMASAVMVATDEVRG